MIRRRWLGIDDGEPVELLTTYIASELASRTDIDSEQPLTGGVRQALETRKRLRVDHITERISARLATADETKPLGITRRDPVLCLAVTAHDATGRPLQLVDVVLPADRHELEDTYPAS